MFAQLGWKIQPLTWQTQCLQNNRRFYFKSYQLLGVSRYFKITHTYIYISKHNDKACLNYKLPTLKILK